MSWVLPDLLNIGSSLGFKNQTQSRFGSGPGFMHTRPEPNLYTYILLKKKLKNPSINTPLSFQIIFLNLTLNPLSLSRPLSLSLKLSLLATLSRPHTNTPLTAVRPHGLIQPHAPLTASLSPTASLSLIAPYLSHSHSRFLSAAPHLVTLTFIHPPTHPFPHPHSHDVVVVICHKGAQDCQIGAWDCQIEEI